MIDGVKVIDLAMHQDDRGYLIEIARHASDPSPHAVVRQFGQVHLVGVPARGTIRAFHKHGTGRRELERVMPRIDVILSDRSAGIGSKDMAA
jgi:dTDP-4-dehydrorhamnose 3,5-epimerase-like enzyme